MYLPEEDDGEIDIAVAKLKKKICQEVKSCWIILMEKQHPRMVTHSSAVLLVFARHIRSTAYHGSRKLRCQKKLVTSLISSGIMDQKT